MTEKEQGLVKFLRNLLGGRKVPAPESITKAEPAPESITKADLDRLAYAIKKGLENTEISIVGGYVKRFDNIQNLIDGTRALIRESQKEIINSVMRLAAQNLELERLLSRSHLYGTAASEKVSESP